MENSDLKNFTIWITGASSGIGKAIAACFFDSEAKLVLSASSPDSFNESSWHLRDKTRTMICTFDISIFDNLERAFKKIESKFGGVDILINNAGISIFKSFHETSQEDFDRTIAINLKAPFFLTQLVLKGMRERKSGMIVNISSVASITPFADCSAYSVSKTGLRMMGQCLMEEVRNEGIKIMNVLPGATNTNIWGDDIRQNNSNNMMNADKIGEIVVNAILSSLSSNAIIEEILIKPQTGNI